VSNVCVLYGICCAAAEATGTVSLVEQGVHVLTDPGGACEGNQALLDVLDSVRVSGLVS
jgi:hypothetical protein